MIRTIKKPGAAQATPGFFRRLAVIIYDLLLLLAVLFSATALLLPLNSGEAFDAHQYFFPVYLVTVSFLFYGWFWTHGGQTLGMRAWKIKLLNRQQQTISWQQAFIRFCGAILSWSTLGLGFLWILIDKKNYSWHDHLSKTALFFDTEDQK